MRVRDWKPSQKNSLCGFFTLILPSGLIIHDVMLFEKNGSRWINLPSRKFIDKQGKEGFKPILEFIGRTVSENFRDQVLKALDRSRS
jgi:DNA-binding cell septation regulator SpoVG